jgi:hypothetical protein
MADRAWTAGRFVAKVPEDIAWILGRPEPLLLKVDDAMATLTFQGANHELVVPIQKRRFPEAQMLARKIVAEHSSTHAWSDADLRALMTLVDPMH